MTRHLSVAHIPAAAPPDQQSIIERCTINNTSSISQTCSKQDDTSVKRPGPLSDTTLNSRRARRTAEKACPCRCAVCAAINLARHLPYLVQESTAQHRAWLCCLELLAKTKRKKIQICFFRGGDLRARLTSVTCSPCPVVVFKASLMHVPVYLLALIVCSVFSHLSLNTIPSIFFRLALRFSVQYG